MRNLLLAFTIAFTGCGMDFEQEQEADCKQDESKCELEEGGADSETAEREETQGELKPLASLDPDAGTNVNVDVEVNVNVNTQQQGPENIPFRLANRRMNWAEAVSNAPNGYHVPTKLELEEILADYDLSFEGYDEEMESPQMVWTFSKSGEVQSWATDLKDGSTHSYDRMVYLEVIYIGDAE